MLQGDLETKKKIEWNFAFIDSDEDYVVFVLSSSDPKIIGVSMWMYQGGSQFFLFFLSLYFFCFLLFF